jgi:hypothetical protein
MYMCVCVCVCVSEDCLKQLSQILVLIEKKETTSQHTRGYVVLNKETNDDRHGCEYNIAYITQSI